MTVPILKGIPLPADASRRFGDPKYPWASMQVGDAFVFIAGVKRESAQAQTSKMNRKLAPKHFITRVDIASGEITCWRQS